MDLIKYRVDKIEDTHARTTNIEISKINNKFWMKIIKSKVTAQFIVKFIDKIKTEWPGIKFADKWIDKRFDN